jgi:hypothetical protein
LLSQRLFAAAVEKSRKALALAGSQYRESTIEAKRIQGLALGFAGSAREGRRWCEEALEMAVVSKNPWLISRAKLALSDVLLEDGDSQGALTNAREAGESFARTGQLASEWRAWLVAARASLNLKDETKAREYAASASRALSTLEEKWGTEVYSRYLTRPDVQYFRKRLKEEFSLRREKN